MMEERQREDRRKLGVPEAAVSVSQLKSRRVRVPRKRSDDEAGADPDLAVALALSLSAAVKDSVTELVRGGVGEDYWGEGCQGAGG